MSSMPVFPCKNTIDVAFVCPNASQVEGPTRGAHCGYPSHDAEGSPSNTHRWNGEVGEWWGMVTLQENYAIYWVEGAMVMKDCGWTKTHVSRLTNRTHPSSLGLPGYRSWPSRNIIQFHGWSLGQWCCGLLHRNCWIANAYTWDIGWCGPWNLLITHVVWLAEAHPYSMCPVWGLHDRVGSVGGSGSHIHIFLRHWCILDKFSMLRPVKEVLDFKEKTDSCINPFAIYMCPRNFLHNR
jgi:hypothetical protein